MSLKKFVVGIMLLSLSAGCSKVPEEPQQKEQAVPTVKNPKLFIDPDNHCEYWILDNRSITPRMTRNGQRGCKNEATF